MITRSIILPLRGPNLQVRTCKIQTKLDSKLGPSVAIKSLITTWEKRNLTTPGRVAIAKSLLLSQLVYIMQVLDFTQESLDEVESLLYAYIKGKTKRNWLSKEQIRTPKNKGGIGFFDITKFYYAQKCTIIRRYAKDQTDDVWCDILDNTLGLSKETRERILEWGDLRLEKISRSAPPLSKELLYGHGQIYKIIP